VRSPGVGSPVDWSDRISEFFTAGIGHFIPLEAAPRFAQAIEGHLG
jgi:hypothetical protein